MHDPATPATLLRGQLWAPWGPPIADRYLTDKVLRLVASRTGRSFEFVQDAIAHSQDRSRYLLIYRLSRTGHAVVYEAVDRRLGREVAVKIHRDARQHAIEKKLFDSQSPGRLAIAESQVMSQLEHANVVRLLDIGEHGPWLFSVIELCDEHLGNWSASLGWQKVLARIIEAANGLAYLHELGYAHGDIKPRNILIKNGAAKLADFGHAAKIRGSRLWFRRCGTAGYIAPEVHDGGAGVEGDVFALAVTLWYCLFRELPYPYTKGREFGGMVEESVQRVIDKNIKPPENVPEGLPRSVFRLLERALDPDPVVRPTLDEFIAPLRAILEQDERRLERRRRVPRRVAGVAIAAGLGFSLGAARYAGSGDGSVVEAVFPADPLVRAEFAAIMGDGAQAVAELDRAVPHARRMSPTDLEQLARRMDEVADILAAYSQSDARAARGISSYVRTMKAP